MYHIFDIAKYICHKLGKVQRSKLHKLCYYSQAWSLVWNDRPLFRHQFQAWLSGPINPCLWYHNRNLSEVGSKDIPGNTSKISDKDKAVIDQVLNFFGPFNSEQLNCLMAKERPWAKARGNIGDSNISKTVITLNSMRKHYFGLLGFEVKPH